MPIYEYRCKKCDHLFERIQRLAERPIRKCPECGEAALEKLISRGAVHFKGTGWYVTDYARKGKPDEADKPEKKKDTGESVDKTTPASKSGSDSKKSTGKKKGD